MSYQDDAAFYCCPNLSIDFYSKVSAQEFKPKYLNALLLLTVKKNIVIHLVEKH